MKSTKCTYKFNGKNVIKNGLPLELSQNNNNGFNKLLQDLEIDLSINGGLLEGLLQ